MIATINTVDGSELGDNLITSHQVDYMFSALILTEAVENDQEHPCHLYHAVSLVTICAKKP